MPRPKALNAYPISYVHLFDRVGRTRETVLLPAERKDALRLRAELYAFRKAAEMANDAGRLASGVSMETLNAVRLTVTDAGLECRHKDSALGVDLITQAIGPVQGPPAIGAPVEAPTEGKVLSADELDNIFKTMRPEDQKNA